MTRLMGGIKKEWVNIVVLAAMLLFPLCGSTYNITLVCKIMAYALLAISYDIMWGYTGMLSFGHSAFFALGAYALGLTLKFCGASSYTYLAFFMAMVIPMLVALTLGYFVFYGRVTGVYFGIITLAFTTILQSAFTNFRNITGGSNGLYKYPAPKFMLPGGFSIDLTNTVTLFYITLVVLVACYILCKIMMQRNFGRITRGIMNNEGRMDFLGYNTAFIKLMVFVLSSGLAGLAGALFAPVGFTSPNLFGLLLSTSVIIWVAVGGRGTLIGAVVGTFIICYMEDILSSNFQTIWQLFEGLFMIAVILFLPQGIMGSVKQKFKKTFIG